MNQLCSSLWTSRFWLSLQCYRDQSPILERRGGGTRLYTGNFNPISSSFIQKCSQKYSLCLLRKGIKLRELTKRNFALRRGILRVKRSLKIVLSQEPTTHRLLPQRTLSALGSGRKVWKLELTACRNGLCYRGVQTGFCHVFQANEGKREASEERQTRATGEDLPFPHHACLTRVSVGG